ncbi:sulfatase-like hydrolase/transferase [Bradyrhizobium lablabi]|uniref:sulfatase family protein n=1 Tax=Bradyrhizobium lablabi TaxID=722472 RepID=UPI001BAD55E8|nr:sulfatase-like hydrolase/transferase [Bradyrhizobium lablabi]MBR1122185.1 sulfatase-like hydrolase/transferase [Bradyrhizobium lablabi]
MSLPNIILIITDQQRADTVAALGAPWMHTPHLDRLAREGTAFTQCFVTSPVCVASRASLFTGKYPHSTHVFTNFEPWQPTWVSSLAAQGYHCVNIGKMHINPYDAAGGFHQRFVVENKDRPLFLEERDRAIYDEWDKALRVRGLTKPSRFNRYEGDPDGYKRALGAFAWHLDADMHPDNFVGNTACWWIEDRKCPDPLFLQIGFPGPHPPYDPLPEWLDRYAEADIPLPEVSDSELQRQPRALKMLRENMTRLNFDSVNWRTDISREDLLRLRRHYAANVSMIDAQVGRIMAALDAKGYLDNAIVIFTSDHADALGDHGHIQKWTMYDTVLRVPLVFWSKERIPGGRRRDELVQLIDIAPTILEAADLPVPPDFEARSLWGALEERADYVPRDVVYSEVARDHVQTGAEFIVMRRCRDWKLVVYLGEEEGELYDLKADPDEKYNLWHKPELRDLRDRMVGETLRWSVAGSLKAHRRPTRAPQKPMPVS